METNVIQATEEFLRNQIAEKDEKIQSLEQQLVTAVESRNRAANALSNMSDSLRSWTLEAMDDEEISLSTAEALAEIGAFELTKEVEVEVSVKYWITLEVPAGENAEDLINEIDFESATHSSAHVVNVSTEVTDIDL